VISQVTVTGTFTTSQGAPAAGQVTFQLTSPITDQDGTYVAPDEVPVVLNGSGEFSQLLWATNDPTTVPTGVEYVISFDVDGAMWVQRAVLPYNAPGGTIDISDLAPA
jgi:hypothetical protein